MWWQTLLEILGGLLLLYLGLLALLWRHSRTDPETRGAREALRLLPDVVRLVRRLAADPSLPGALRVRLALLLIYLASPVDLVPDFIPVLGSADDAIAVALVLRSVVRRAGPAAVARHWPGTPEGLRLVERLTGQPTSP